MMTESRIKSVEAEVNGLNVLYSSEFFINIKENESSRIKINANLKAGGEHVILFDIRKLADPIEKDTIENGVDGEAEIKSAFTINYSDAKNIVSVTKKPMRLFKVNTVSNGIRKNVEQVFFNFILKPLHMKTMVFKIIILSEILNDE